MTAAFSIEQLQPARPSCITIGNFDGAHLGHQSLLRLALSTAREKALDFIVITFWPHPREIIKGPGAHMPLTSRERRLHLLAGLGADHILELPFTPELAALSAEEFVKRHLLPLKAAELVIGHDFSLGRERQGNAEALSVLARKYGFSLRQAPQFFVNGEAASSTLARRHILAGDVAAAARLLGRPHTVCGEVGHGYGRGAGIGFPTANLVNPDALLPANGVYACFAACAGHNYEAVVNIGFNPTFGNAQKSVEAFLLNADANLYGQSLCLSFIAFLRNERKFDSPAELSGQIARDVEQARDILTGAQPLNIFTLKIESLAHDGRGIGFLPAPGQGRGMAVFVDRALPGETIVCAPGHKAANYMEAEKLDVTARDFTPQLPHCPQQQQCGGCQLQALPYGLQLLHKEKLVLDAMARIGRLPHDALGHAWQGILPSPLTRSFRRKISLAFGNAENGKAALGFRKNASHDIVPFADCALVEKSAWPIVAQLRDLALGAPLAEIKAGYWRQAILWLAAPEPDADPAWHLLLRTQPGGRRARRFAAGLGERLLGSQASLAAFAHEEGAKPRRVCAFSRSSGKAGNMFLAMGGRQFGLDIGSFFQVNIQAAELLAEEALRLDQAACGPLLDLFCGSGAPGQLLAGRHESCLGIEQDAAAIAWAKRNGAGIENWLYEQGDAAKALRRLASESRPVAFGAALLDPPRAGLGLAAARDLIKLAPRRIIHISCDAATLARDAGALQAAYELESLRGVDMFPHTPHVECASLWRLRKG